MFEEVRDLNTRASSCDCISIERLSYRDVESCAEPQPKLSHEQSKPQGL